MMRQIKFRALISNEDSTSHKMISVTILDFMKNADGTIENNSEGYDEENNRFRFSIEKAKLTQFTGLLDKNGKEIYEGDVFDCPYAKETIEHHHKWQIVWDEIEARFALKRIGNPCNQSMVRQTISDMTRREILGDIYTSPHLLTSEVN